MIEKVAETLATPEAWTRAAFARTATGRVIGPATRSAVCFCLEGALRRVAPDGWHRWLAFIGQAIVEQFPQRTVAGSVPCFNDHPDTTHEDILLVLRRARELELASA